VAEPSTDVLEGALRDLGGAIEGPAVNESMLVRVQSAISREPVPSHSYVKSAVSSAELWVKARMKWLVTLVVALLFIGFAASPVGAEVAEWFGFHGVLVVENEDAPTGEPNVPAVHGELTLEQAAQAAGFEPAVPSLLGSPDGVEADPERHLVSMSWDSPGGIIRLDQFDAELSPLFWKSTRAAVLVQLIAAEGLWFPVPHEVVILEPDGEVSIPARLAATTLIWPQDGRTLRLEGSFSRAEAIEIANSVP